MNCRPLAVATAEAIAAATATATAVAVPPPAPAPAPKGREGPRSKGFRVVAWQNIEHFQNSGQGQRQGSMSRRLTAARGLRPSGSQIGDWQVMTRWLP
jgi:hypothetical protein